MEPVRFQGLHTFAWIDATFVIIDIALDPNFKKHIFIPLFFFFFV